ncbi:MAG: PAS domain S-box protein, partial [Chloroflexota bacterium]
MTGREIDNTTWQRLHEHAEREGCSVNELLNTLLGDSRTADANPQEPQHQPGERYCELLAEHAQDIIYRVRLVPDQRFEYVSPSVTEIIGYTPEDHYADPTLGYRLVHPDDRHLLQAAANQADSAPLVLRWVRKDGTVIWMEQRNQVIYDDSGQPVALEGIARNITERKAFESALQEKSDQLEYFFRQGPNLLCIADTDGHFIQVNDAWESLLGYSHKMLKGRSFMDFVHPDDHAATLEAISTLSAQQPIANFTNRYRAHDGSYRHIEWNSKPYGQYIFASAQDITERLKSEQERRDAFELLQTIIDHIPVMIALFDAEGRFTYVNKYWIERLGWTSDELAEYDEPLALFYPDPADRKKALDFMLSTQPGWRDFQTRTKGGEILDTSWANVRLSDGRSIGIGQDITRRKFAEDALTESENRYRLLSELTFEGIIIHNGGVLVDANRAFQQMFGYSLDELLGRQVIDLLFEPEWHEQVSESVVGHYVEPYEVIATASDGRRFPVEIEARQISDALRVASVRDITQRKQTEAYALENERLKARFQKEQQQNALIQRIIAALSHDLRTPLSVIASSRDMLSRYFDRLSDEQRQEKLNTIGRQIHFALNLLEDTVQMARG